MESHTPSFKKKRRPKNVFKISFDNKNIEKVNKINKIKLNLNPFVEAALRKTSAHFDTPTVFSALTNSIGFKIFNFLTSLIILV